MELVVPNYCSSIGHFKLMSYLYARLTFLVSCDVVFVVVEIDLKLFGSVG